MRKKIWNGRTNNCGPYFQLTDSRKFVPPAMDRSML